MDRDGDPSELTPPLEIGNRGKLKRKPKDIEELANIQKLFTLFSSANRILAFNEYINGVTEKELFELYGEHVNGQTIHNNIEDFYDINDYFDNWAGEELIYHTNEQDNPLEIAQGEPTKNPLIHDEENEYNLTPLGQHLAEIFEEVASFSEYYFDVLPLIRHLDSGWYEILGREELQQISREDIKEYTGSRQASGVRTDFNRDMRGNSSIREMLTWNAHDNWEDRFIEIFANEGATGEIILRKSDVIDEAPKEGGMSRDTAKKVAEHGADLYVYTGDYPGVLFIGDEEVALWGWGPDEDYHDAGVYRGSDLYDWAETEFERLKEKSDPDWESYEWTDGSEKKIG